MRLFTASLMTGLSAQQVVEELAGGGISIPEETLIENLTLDDLQGAT
jgi:hypothetical protein